MASVDNGLVIFLESSLANANVGGNTVYNDSSSFISPVEFNIMAPQDDGTITLTLENNSSTPANGLQSNTNVLDSKKLNSNTYHTAFEESEIINTILFPASAYDSLVEPAVQFYKLRGYYIAGMIFETWVTSDPTTPPPSGHTLTNISVVDSWTV